MAKMTETELRIKLRKGGSGGGSSGPTATRVGDTWEYSEAVLYLAYASNITSATTSGIIANQSDATGFQLTPFNSAGSLLNWRGSMFSKSMYQSGDATDYIWEDITSSSGAVSFIRYYTNSTRLMINLGTPDTPGAGVTWISIPPTDPIPGTAFWVAEQYTMNNVESSWEVYPVKTKAAGFGLVAWTKSPVTAMPALNSTAWNDDVLVAVSAHTGTTYSSVTEIGYGTAIVITYSDGKLYGLLREVSGVATWVVAPNFIEGDLIVDGTINADQIGANAITAGKLLVTGSGADTIVPGTIGAGTIASVTAAQTAANTAITNAATAQGTADGKVTTFFQTTAPTAEGVGDLWSDTNDGNTLYRWNGTAWVNVQDSDMATAIADAATAQSTADGKIVSFYQTTAPTAEGVGDLWTDTNDGNRLYRWSGSAWVSVRDTTLVLPADVAAAVNNNTTTILGSKITTGSLAALSANLGTVTTGKMQSADGKFVIDLTNKFISITV